ncbi:37S ribosomal protein S9, mitochondrial [Coemansia sp. RSA 2559]|nr:37S ribosomal protein S9, mitochondrial [Coemansia sp. RSA 2559]KAJ2869358.1 37S ribosomal protein S9, mitochondrial [Coemansia erecta]
MLARLRITGTRVPHIVGRRMITQESSNSSKLPFDSLDIRPVKRPDTPSYFMPKPKYYDMLVGVTNIVQRHLQPRRIGTKSKQKRAPNWLNQKDFEAKFDLKLSDNEFKDFRLQLRAANNAIIPDEAERNTVDLYLAQFTREGTVRRDYEEHDRNQVKRVKKKKKRSAKRAFKDDMGRWTASGRRKEALASAIVAPVNPPERGSDVDIADRLMNATFTVSRLFASIRYTAQWLEKNGYGSSGETAAAVDGAWIAPEAEAEPRQEIAYQHPSKIECIKHAPLGEVLVNGRPLAEYFVRDANRDAVLLPLTMTKSVGLYNVFLRVKGGGHSGQAEACQLALSRALLHANCGRHGIMKAAGLLTADDRFVERKKTGKPKARKSYTWVKR